MFRRFMHPLGLIPGRGLLPASPESITPACPFFDSLSPFHSHLWLWIPGSRILRQVLRSATRMTPPRGWPCLWRPVRVACGGNYLPKERPSHEGLTSTEIRDAGPGNGARAVAGVGG